MPIQVEDFAVKVEDGAAKVEDYAVKSVLVFAFAMFVASVSVLEAKADVAPKGIDELRESEVIAVGTIRKIRVESERSQIERAFGNYDWGIYLTLEIEKVEKGRLIDGEVVFRCFRVKSRRSAMEYLSPSGHDPIPDVGTRCRVYLGRGETNWFAALPNGITLPDANQDDQVWSDPRLVDANEVSELRSLAYTFVIPLELWVMLVVLLVPIFIVIKFVRRRSRRKTIEQVDEGPHSGPL